MQVKVTQPSSTEAIVTIVATDSELQGIKTHVLTHFQDVKVPGFRTGKVPAEVLEKHVDPNMLQTRFIEEAIEQLYGQALLAQKLRPVDNPKIKLQKFVPFDVLEFEAEIPVVGKIVLPDYKKIKLTKPTANVTAKDINEVIASLRTRMADKKDVDRAAKLGDQTWIDFDGVDNKKQVVEGASGKDYPLVLGSNSFIPGFEDNLIGLKAGDKKTFTLTFPKDYGVKALANRNVTFTVNITKVQEVVEPKLDDDFAAKVGPFKTVAALKADIKKQLLHERKHETDRNFESELIKSISDKSKVDIPEVLINDNAERLINELRQNLTYRGQTMQEFLAAEGKTEEQYREEIVKPQSQERVKASLVLSEISELEGLNVTAEELEVRMQILKGQYTDPQMQAELNKPEARQDIANRILTEKTIAKLVSYATSSKEY